MRRGDVGRDAAGRVPARGERRPPPGRDGPPRCGRPRPRLRRRRHVHQQRQRRLRRVGRARRRSRTGWKPRSSASSGSRSPRSFDRSPSLRAALELRPFEVAAGDTYFVTFLKDAPPAAVARRARGRIERVRHARRRRTRCALAHARAVGGDARPVVDVAPPGRADGHHEPQHDDAPQAGRPLRMSARRWAPRLGAPPVASRG